MSVAISPPPSVEDYRRAYKEAGWPYVNDKVDELTDACRQVARELKEATAGVYTRSPIGYHYDPDSDTIALHAPPDTSTQDTVLCKAAARHVAAVAEKPLAGQEAEGWPKLAYSPTLRTAGEYLNFFPGKYPGGIPNSPGPIQAMLTSGMLGAGLGYGGGWLASRLFPERWDRRRLPKVLAALGAGAGAVLPAAWMYANARTGKPFYDNSLLNNPRPKSAAEAASAALAVDLDPAYKAATDTLREVWAEVIEEDRIKSAEFFFSHQEMKEAFDSPTMLSQFAQPAQPSPLDVNINTMGQTLWEVGAAPGTTAMTMGALHAASQLPGGSPGWVSPGQLGRLAANMGAGYLAGALGGAALGTLTGMDETDRDRLKRTGAFLGIVNWVVPKIYGQ